MALIHIIAQQAMYLFLRDLCVFFQSMRNMLQLYELTWQTEDSCFSAFSVIFSQV